MVTKKDFAALMGLLAGASFKGNAPLFITTVVVDNKERKELTSTGKVWYQMLAEYPAQLLEQGVVSVIRNEEFFPSIATLVKHIQNILPPQPDGTEAWGKIEQEIRTSGRYQQPAFENQPDKALLIEVVKAMGWQSLCNAEEKQIAALRAQARDIYNSIKNRQTQEKRFRALHTHIGAQALEYLEAAHG